MPRGPDEVQSGHRRFEASAKDWVAAMQGKTLDELRVQERIPPHVDAVSGPQQEMIHGPHVPVPQGQLHGIVRLLRADHLRGESDRNRMQPLLQPCCPRRPDRPRRERILDRPGEPSEEIRDRHDPRQPHRADVRGGVDDRREPTQCTVVLPAVKPMHVVLAHKHVWCRPAFGQERRRLERALASADDRHPLPPESVQIAVIAGVCDAVLAEFAEAPRPGLEPTDTGGHDDSRGSELVAVVQRHHEPPVRGGDVRDGPTVDVRRHGLLDPLAVCHEPFDREGSIEAIAGRRLIRVERERACVSHDAGRRRVRPQEHPLGHPPPERHGVSEDRGLHSGRT